MRLNDPSAPPRVLPQRFSRRERVKHLQADLAQCRRSVADLLGALESNRESIRTWAEAAARWKAASDRWERQFYAERAVRVKWQEKAELAERALSVLGSYSEGEK